MDYVVESILYPNKAIKDGYASLIVTTKDGDLVQGIKVREDKTELVLRDNLRDEFSIPIAEIKSRKDGGSLMPSGLADAMTHGEFVDLVRFVSDLGKPGPYAAPSPSVVRRWRVLDPSSVTAAAASKSAPPAADLPWYSAYSLVHGDLAIDEVTGAPGAAAGFARCEIDVTDPGPIRLAFNSVKGLTIWVDQTPVEAKGPSLDVDLAKGIRVVTVKVDAAARGAEPIRLEVTEAPGSKARALPVAGR